MKLGKRVEVLDQGARPPEYDAALLTSANMSCEDALAIHEVRHGGIDPDRVLWIELVGVEAVR